MNVGLAGVLTISGLIVTLVNVVGILWRLEPPSPRLMAVFIVFVVGAIWLLDQPWPESWHWQPPSADEFYTH